MGKADLYADLGVSREATAAEIRSAFKKRVKKTHPDVGGNPDEFAKVTMAKLILLDPKRRAKYDEDGTIDAEPDNELAVIMNYATAAIDEVLKQCDKTRRRPDTVDVVALAKDVLRDTVNRVKAEISKLKGGVSECRSIAKRFKSKKGKANRIRAVYDARAGDIERRIAACENDRDKYQKAIDLLGEHEFEFDVPDSSPPLPMGILGFPVNFTGT